MIGSEIRRGDETTALLEVVGDGLADRAPIEGVASAARDLLERGGERRVLEDVAGRWRLARRQQDRRGVRVAGQDVGNLAPLPGHDLADAVAFARVADRRLERLREGNRAVPGQQLVPPVHDARHTDRERAAQRNAIDVTLLKLLEGCRGWRATAGVESVDRLRFGVVEEGKEIAADPVHRRFHDRQDGGGGDRGVDGVAAGLQHLEAGRRGERLTGGDGAVARHDDRSRRPRIRRRPVTWQLRNQCSG